MNSSSRSRAAAVLAAWLALSLPLSVLAEEPASPPPKEEVIYANLATDGSLQSLYVVNSYDLEEETAITDYGEYTQVKNLTTTQPLSVEEGAVSFTAPAGKFYYQGALAGREIPWLVEVTYRLDGQPISGEELAGASGHLEMTLDLRQNPNADPRYREDFSLQTTISLDSERCRNIQAPQATVANAGGNKQLSYILLAGDEGHFSIAADVTNFEMDGIQINAIPLTLTIDDPDTSEIKDRIYDLQDGARQLDDGAQTLRDGVGQLQEGSADLEEGAYDLWDGARELYRGSKKLSDGSQELAEGAVSLRDGFQQLEAGGASLKEGIASFQGQVASALENAGFPPSLPETPEDPLSPAYLLQVGKVLDTDLQQAIDALTGLSGQLSEDSGLAPAEQPAEEPVLSPEEKPAITPGDPIALDGTGGETPLPPEETGGTPAGQPETGDPLPDEEVPSAPEGDGSSSQENNPPSLEEGDAGEKEASGPDSAPVEEPSSAGTADGGEPVSQVLAAAAPEMDPATLQATLATLVQLRQMNQLVNGQLEYLAGVEALAGGFDQLYQGLDQLLGGIDELADGSSSLRSGAGDLYDGSVDLKEGTEDLYDGTVELEDGTAQLKEESADMDGEVDDRIQEILDEYRGGNSQPVSFVSPRNTQVESVQFVLKTAEITLPDDPAPVQEEEPSLTLWQRFLNLFSFLLD